MTIASLGLAVDSAPAVRAAVDLDKLAASAATAEQAATKLGTTAPAALAKVAAGAGPISQKLREAANDAESFAARINKALNVASNAPVIGSSWTTPFAGDSTRGADIDAYGRSLDTLRAKYNPLFAAINQYKVAQAEIRQAHAFGAISVNEMTVALERERTAALASISALKGRGAALADTPVQRAAGGGTGTFQTANIGAQFQDIAVTAAMGQSLATIALQQGTQLSAVLNTMGGFKGAAAGLASAFVSILNPISLVTIGLVAASAAAIQYFMTLKSDTPTAEEALKKHEALIQRIEAAWPGATDAIKRYSAESGSVLEASARQNISVIEAQSREMNKALAQSFGSGGTGARTGGNIFRVSNDFKAFAEPIMQLRKEISAGNPDFKEFQDRVAAIGATDPKGLQETADKVLLLGNEAYTMDGKLKEAKGTLGSIGATAAAQMEQLGQFTAAMRELSGIALPKLDDSQLAQYQYEVATNRASTREDKDSAYMNYQDALARIEERTRLANVPTPDEKPNLESFKIPKDPGVAKSAREAERAANAYRDLIKSVDDRIGQMELEAQLVGKTGVEADAYRLKLELLQKAEDKGRSASPAQVAEIESKVAAYQKLAEATAKATLQSELQFEREQMFRSATDQTIASTLKGAGLPVDFDSYEAGLIRTNEQLKEARELAGDFASTFIQGIESGKSVFESLGDAALSVLDKITDKMLNDVLNALFEVNGAGSGSSGGIFGSILGALGLGGGGGMSSSYFPPAPSMGGGGLYANGDAFPNGVSGFRNTIVDSPTVFKFAKGTGMMGEAGPEAIMPLKRDSAGRLGVSAQTGGAANSNKPQEVTLRIVNEEGPMFRTTIRAESEEVSVKVVQQNNENQKNYKQNGGE